MPPGLQLKNDQPHSSCPSHFIIDQIDHAFSSCLNDQKRADRLQTRRDFILNELFPVDHHFDVLEDCRDPPPVWVPGKFLRSYFSCNDAFDEFLEHDIIEDVVSVSACLCSHNQKGLHPREARRGKLISSVMYETITQTLAQERAALLSHGDSMEVEHQDGFVVTSSENMYCQECVDEYHLNLRPKVELLDDYLFLYRELDTASDDAPLQYGLGPTSDQDQDKYVYLVSRRFCSALRDHVKQIMKRVAPADSDSLKLDENYLPKYETIAEGIEVIDIKDIQISTTSGDVDNSAIDIYVNKAITCAYLLDVNIASQRQISCFISSQVHMGAVINSTKRSSDLYLGGSGKSYGDCSPIVLSIVYPGKARTRLKTSKLASHARSVRRRATWLMFFQSN